MPPFLERLLHGLVEALAFSLVGVVVFSVTFMVIVKMTPFSIRKEIEEDQNTSLAILIGAVIVGIAIVVSGAIKGS